MLLVLLFLLLFLVFVFVVIYGVIVNTLEARAACGDLIPSHFQHQLQWTL